MFMIARHGLRARVMRPIRSRTPCEPYWASCMPSTTRSYTRGSISSGVFAESAPGRVFDSISSSDSRPRTGKRTRVPSRLIRSAVGRVHTSETRCPAISSLVPNKEP